MFVLAVEYHPDQKVVKDRYEICKGCDKHDAESDECAICTCFMEEKTKLLKHHDPKLETVIVTHCPLGKWGDKEIANFYKS